MTKEITKANILQEIYDRFKMRELVPAKFAFDETVVPIYNIAPHLSEWHVETNTVSITSAAGYTYFTVPANEEWTLRGYYILFLSSGTHTVSGLFISRRPELESLYLDLEAGHAVSYIVNLPQHVILPPRSMVGLLIDSYTSTYDLTLKLDVKKEIIR